MALNILCCNPLIAFTLYGLALVLLWVITRADINWSLLGVMGIYVGMRVLFDIVLFLVDHFDPVELLTVRMAFFGSLPLLAMLMGWIVGGMFRTEYA